MEEIATEVKTLVVMCPDTACRYNGFGECQLGLVLTALENNTVTASHCPYFTTGEEPENPQEDQDNPF